MKNLGFNKKTVILVMSILVVISFLMLMAINVSKDISTEPPPIVTFSPSPRTNFNPTIPGEPSNGVGPNADPAVAKQFEEDLANQQIFIEAQERVTNLTSTLPYTGRNFTLSYDISINRFTLALDQNNRTAGQEEFDQFLSSRNIDKKYMEVVIVSR